MSKHNGTETPETFVSAFAKIALAKVAEALRGPLENACKVITVREGFPRGAAYTMHASADKHANASAAVERTAEGFDLILSNMIGARSADAIGRLAKHCAETLYPARKAEGKAKADHQTKARNDFLTALGLSRTRDGWRYADPNWDELTALMPLQRYEGSKLPDANAREMIAFFVAAENGESTKNKVYISLKKDGSDSGFVRALYARGFLAGTVKSSAPDAYKAPKIEGAVAA